MGSLRAILLLSLIYLPYCTNINRADSPLSQADSEDSAAFSQEKCSAIIKATKLPTWRWGVRTGNPGKKGEFESFFRMEGLTLHFFDGADMREVDADPRTVITHKASMTKRDGTVVEDAALEVPGANIGVRIKWHVDHLMRYVGRDATLLTHMAYRIGDVVFIFRGDVKGTLVNPKGPEVPGFKLNRYFQPIGSTRTLAEDVAGIHNPRQRVFKDLVRGSFSLCTPAIKDWKGPWQEGQPLPPS